MLIIQHIERIKKLPIRADKEDSKMEVRTTTGKRANKENTQTRPSSEQVQRKAYELFEQRGRQPGHELEDWFKAEQIVTSRTNFKVTR